MMKEFEEIKVKVEKEFPSLCIDFKIVNEDLVEINYSLKNHPEIKTQIKYERFPMESVIKILTNDAFHQGITKSIEKRLLSERCIKKIISKRVYHEDVISYIENGDWVKGRMKKDVNFWKHSNRKRDSITGRFTKK